MVHTPEPTQNLSAIQVSRSSSRRGLPQCIPSYSSDVTVSRAIPSAGLADAIEILAEAGCRQIWLNGSFVTAKDEPGDFEDLDPVRGGTPWSWSQW
jgi:hypothetical protein